MANSIGLSIITLFALAGLGFQNCCSNAQQTGSDLEAEKANLDETPEVGKVTWSRDLGAAQEISRKTGKPIFLQFQEIPGCQTCQDYGNGPLSHPLLVEAIEDLFVPVLIHNNKKGKDADILKRFGESSWNNPVVRFIDADSKDIIPRKDSVWETTALAGRMVASLKANQSKVPNYLASVAHQKPNRETAIFAMHCYWEGEAKLGMLDGVLNTRSAWIGKKEVVEVDFDPTVTNYQTILTTARKMECATTIFATNSRQNEIASIEYAKDVKSLQKGFEPRVAKESDQKYYLRNSSYRHLPLTKAQSTKINAILGKQILEKKMSRKEFESLISNQLSPRQIELHKQTIKATKSNPKSLNKFVFPENDNELTDYQTALQNRLTSLAKSK